MVDDIKEDSEKMLCYLAMWIVTTSVYMSSLIVMITKDMILEWVIFVAIPFILLWHVGFDKLWDKYARN
jgi:hypothetical protein